MKQTLLLQIRKADRHIKLIILSPFLLPIFAFWVGMYETGSGGMKNVTSGFDVFMRVFIGSVFLGSLFPLIGAMLVFKELGKLSKSHSRKKSVELDWSKEKFKVLADELLRAGMKPRKFKARLEFSQRFNIRIYTHPRTYRNAGLVMFLVFIVARVFKSSVEKAATGPLGFDAPAPRAFIWGLAVFFSVVVISFFWDTLLPRLSLCVSIGTLGLLKTNPGKARVLLAHELSHVRHRDPVKKIIWLTQSGVIRIVLGIWCLYVLIFSFEKSGSTMLALLTCAGFISLAVAISKVRGLIPLLQELRADLDAVGTSSDVLLLRELLDVPVMSSPALPVYGGCNLWRRYKAKQRLAEEAKFVERQREMRYHRLDMLECGDIYVLSCRRFRKLIIFAFASIALNFAMLTLFVAQFY